MQLTSPFRISAPCHLTEIVVNPGKDGEHGTKAHHIVEMCYHVIRVMIRSVYARLRQNNAGDPAHCEQEQEAKRP